MIIPVINQKRLTGKTCTSVHLAYWLSKNNKESIKLIDADVQASSSEWLRALNGEIPCVANSFHPSILPSFLRRKMRKEDAEG
jgi:cellulose biosynthesis protein BcsQ